MTVTHTKINKIPTNHKDAQNHRFFLIATSWLAMRTRYIFVIASLANTYMIGPVLTFVKAECRERHRVYMHMKTIVYLSIYTLLL